MATWGRTRCPVSAGKALCCSATRCPAAGAQGVPEGRRPQPFKPKSIAYLAPPPLILIKGIKIFLPLKRTFEVWD